MTKQTTKQEIPVSFALDLKIPEEKDLYSILSKHYSDYFSGYSDKKSVRLFNKSKNKDDMYSHRDLVINALGFIIRSKGLEDAFIKIHEKGEIYMDEKGVDSLKLAVLCSEFRLLDTSYDLGRWKYVLNPESFTQNIRSLLLTYVKRYRNSLHMRKAWEALKK